jgi:hypothetical protein
MLLMLVFAIATALMAQPPSETWQREAAPSHIPAPVPSRTAFPRYDVAAYCHGEGTIPGLVNPDECAAGEYANRALTVGDWAALPDAAKAECAANSASYATLHMCVMSFTRSR